MNDDSKFRAIPKLSAFKIPFKLDEESLLDWLMGLNLSDAQSACSQIMGLLQTLNKTELSAKHRLVFLNRINDYLKQHINRMEHHCWDSGFPLSEQETVYAELVTWNYLLLAQGFFITSENSSKKDDIVFSLAMTLHALGQAHLHIAATYSSPNTGFWSFIYQAFHSAEKKNLLHLAAESSDFKAMTINSLFVRSLIFHLCDSSQFSPKDTRSIFNFLPQVCTHLPITLYPGAQQLETFMLDLKYDNPPTHVKNQVELGSELVRYFSTIPVAHEIAHILKDNDLWHGTLKSINNTLFTRVAKTLELKRKRRYKRHLETNFSLLAVAGFDSILGFLYSMTERPQFSSHNAPEPNKPERPTKSIFTLTQHDSMFTLNHHDEELLKQKTQAAGNAGNEKIWDKNKALTNTPNTNVSLKKISIYDSSTNGYALAWNPPLTNGKVGDLIGIISADKKRLEIAIVRRIILTSEDVIHRVAIHAGIVDNHPYFRLGAEVIGFESEIVYLASVVDKTKGVWAILIPEIELLKRPDAVIYKTGNFNVGEIVQIHRGDKVRPALLLRELHSTMAVSYVELAYPKQ